MYKHLRRLYELRDELKGLNAKYNENYEIEYLNQWITKCIESDMSPDNFYNKLEKEYVKLKKNNDKTYHTAAMMIIYC